MKRFNPWPLSRGTPDIVGIGAINVDYIAPYSRLKTMRSDLVKELHDRFEHGREHPVSTQELQRNLDRLSPYVTPFPGGSAFNAVHCAQQTRIGITVGFVGVAGTNSRVGFADIFSRLDIDGQYVEPVETPANRCISYTEHGKRTLITEKDQQGGLARAFGQRRSELVEYLRGARIVHVTSLTHEEDAGFVTNVVLEARRRTPALRLSVDPGTLWAEAAVGSPPSQAVRDLMAAADYLFLNPKEFEILAPLPALAGNEDLQEAVAHLLPRAPSRQRLLVLKGYEQTEVHTRISEAVRSRVYPHQTVSMETIDDSTGAGDVFAGAFLAGTLLGLDHSERCALAARLVQAKLRGTGTEPFATFAGLVELSAKMPVSPEATAMPILPLTAPSRVTLAWIWDHVSWSLWASAVAILFSAVGLGMAVGKSQLAAEVIGKLQSAPPAASTPKLGGSAGAN